MYIWSLSRVTGLLVSSCVIFLFIGCKGDAPRDQPHRMGEYIDVEPTDEAAYENFKPAAADHFADIDGKVIDGVYTPLQRIGSDGKRIKDDNIAAHTGLTPLEIKGRNAWMLWTGGNELFWDWLSSNGYGSIDMLKVIDSGTDGELRKTRFRRAGLINEPGMRPPTKLETEAAYGIRYDRPTDGYYANNPYCESPPDPAVYGYPTGIVGLRIFKNPEFASSPKAQRDWEKNKHRFYSEADEDRAYASNPRTIKPYVVGTSCAICHVSHHPLNPPKDPESPEWENISSTIGAQYLRVRGVFGNTLKDDSYLYHVMDSQFPGTIDTSLIASDNINNANTMNAIFGLKSRVTRSLYNPPETLSRESYGPDGNHYPGLWNTDMSYNNYGDYPPGFADQKEELENNPRRVPRVLVDGSDSVGTWIALARVYLNIGTYHQQWVRTHNTILGFREQDPFTLADCEANSVYWHGTRVRVDSITAYFLKSSDPMLLKDAIVHDNSVKKFPDGYTGLPTDEKLKTARQVFAKGCIACHSSKQPDYKDLKVVDDGGKSIHARTLTLDDLWRLTRGDGKLPDDYALWAQKAVDHPEFWDDNYLSTDMRIPVTMTETNSARAMATNAKTDHVWEDFASNTFKNLPSVGTIEYRDPFSGATNTYEASSGGPGYYRVPTLISAWATAPYLHNNSLGTFNNDPSVKGRLEAFDDGINKLLFPEKRLESNHDLAKLDESAAQSREQLAKDGGLVWRTSRRTDFKIQGHQVPSLISGYTGFTRFWVSLIPWLPSLALLLFGVFLLAGDPIRRYTRKIETGRPQITFMLMLGRVFWFLVLLLPGLIFGYIGFKYFSVFRMVEVGSGWEFPWITVQIFAIAVLLILISFYVLYKHERFSRVVAIASFIFAIVFALGFGRFASGLGGDLAIGPFPKGMPVNLIVNVDPDASIPDLKKVGNALIEQFKKHEDGEEGDEQELRDFEENVAPHLMNVSKCPDLVLDRGHDYKFIQQLSDQEKRELIQLIKTF